MNPLGSTSPYDLFDNAQNFDFAANSITEAIWKDRFGKSRHTWYGIESMALQAMLNYGYITKKSFEQGAALYTPNTVLQLESNGEYYRWDGDWTQPKVVAPASTPETTGGIGPGKWVGVGDASLRSDLFAGPVRVRVGGLALRDFYSVRDWGVLGNGTEESAKFQKAMDDVEAFGGGVLLIPAGMKIKCWERLYGRKGVSIKCDPTSWLDFRGAPWLTPNNNMALLGYYGTAGSFITPSADMTFGSNKIAVPDASAFKVGDMLELSMDDHGKWNDTSVTVTAGQLAIVTGVYPATRNIVISEPIYETLTLDKGARIRIIDPVEDIIVDGLGIIGNGRNPSGNAEQGLKFFFGRNVQIKNCRMKDVDTQSIGVVSCYDGLIADNRVDHPPLGTIDVISYAIVYSSSMHIEIHGNHGINARHGIISSHLARMYGYYGVSRFIDIHNNKHTSNYGDLASAGFVRAHAGIATHTDAEFVSAYENTVVGCRYGVNIRTPNNSVKNNKIHDCPVGVYASEYWADLEVAYNDFYDCPNPIMSDVTPYELPRGLINIHDNTFARCGGSAMQFPVSFKSTLLYDRNTVRQPINTGVTATFSAYNNVDFSASDNNIQVNDTFAFRAAGTGMQKIMGTKIKYLVKATSAAVNIVSATNFVVAGTIVEVPVGSTGGNIACPTRLDAPNSIVTGNYKIEV